MAMDPSMAVFNALSAYLNELALGDLFQIDANGNPSGWLWNQIVGGVDNEATLIPALENTKAFKTRYKVIFDLRERAAKGEPVQVLSARAVREYENTFSNMMRQAGMPPWFYDSYKDMHKLIGQGVSPTELEQRIATGWTMVRDADPAVRQAFTDFYGVGTGDAALAAYILDPEMAISKLEQSSRAAYTAGYGRSMGINVDRTLAERVAAMPLSEAGIQQGLGEVSGLSGVFNEGITETDNLTTETGVQASLLNSGAAKQSIENRLIERQSASRSTTGGAAQTQQGVVGLKNV